MTCGRALFCLADRCIVRLYVFAREPQRLSATAGRKFQTVQVEDFYGAPTTADKLLPLKRGNSRRDGRALDAQQLREGVLRDGYRPSRRTVAHIEKDARQPVLDGMKRIARYKLPGFSQQEFDVMVDGAAQSSALRKELTIGRRGEAP